MIDGVAGRTYRGASRTKGRGSARRSTALAARPGAQRPPTSPRASSRKPPTTPDETGTLAAARRGTQRERLLGAILHAAAHEGYEALTIGQIITLAGVSRPTFYEYFTDKEDCFIQALAPCRRQLLADVRDAVAGEPPEHATTALAAALLAFAESQPSAFRLLMSDPLAGGSRLLDARDELLAQLARALEDAFRQAPASAMIADLSPRLLAGVICRLLSCSLTQREPSLREMLPELLDWISSYELPASRHTWRELAPVTVARSPFLAPAPLRAPPPLPARSRVGADALSENQWLRIVFATAEIVARDGYAAATVGEITRLAGVDGRAFYALFTGKQQALAAAREMLFRHLMAVSAGAFVVGESWPERLWEAARALTQAIEQNATLSHVSFVESHAGGPAAIRRLEELICAFTIFLQEGRRCEPAGTARPRGAPSRLVQQAIVNSVFVLCYRQARARDGHGIAELLGPVMFMILAPFLGAAQANDFLARKLSATPRSFAAGVERSHVLPPDREAVAGP